MIVGLNMNAIYHMRSRSGQIKPMTVAACAGFGGFVGLGSSAQRSTPTVQRPGPSYSRDVVPILRTACIGCHGEQNPPGGITLTSYMGLMKGGKSGLAVMPG